MAALQCPHPSGRGATWRAMVAPLAQLAVAEPLMPFHELLKGTLLGFGMWKCMSQAFQTC